MSNAYIAEFFIEELGSSSKSYDHCHLVHRIDLVVEIVEVVVVVVVVDMLVVVVVDILVGVGVDDILVGVGVLDILVGVVVDILVGVVDILVGVVDILVGVVDILVGEVRHMFVEEQVQVQVQGMVLALDMVEELEQVREWVLVAIVDKVAPMVHRQLLMNVVIQ
jgi:hypothetical protein